MTPTQQAEQYLTGVVQYKLGRIDRVKRSVNAGIVIGTTVVIVATFAYLVWFALQR